MSAGNGRFAAVFFDLDGTLVSERIGVREARRAVATRMIELGVWDRPADAFADLVEAVIHDILHDNDWHWPEWLSSEEWLRRTLAAGEVKVYGDELTELSQLYREQRVARAAAIAGWQEALTAARMHGPIGVITNFSDGEMQRDKIASAGLTGTFDGVFISGEVGIAKPEPGIFEHACREFGVAMADCVHIGNSVISDVDGALAAGMTAVLVEEDDRERPKGLNGDVVWCEDLYAVAQWLKRLRTA